jgi:8-oxo-dGTP pyrophosphatase MutT (NUDIX family)
MDETTPRVRQHRVAFEGRVFHIDRDEIELAGGIVTTLDIVRHRGSVVLVPQPDRDHIVLIRQFRYAIGRWIWEVPAGTLEAGEPIEDAARRECEEEIRQTPGRVTRLGAFYPSPGFCDELMTFYRLEELAPLTHAAPPDEDEQIEPRIFSLSEVREMIARGDVADMKTVLALTLI